VIAGAICEQSDCTGLILVVLGLAAAAVLLSVLTAVGVGLYVDDVFADRRWRRTVRIATSAGAGVLSVSLLWLLVWVPFVGPPAALGASIGAVPLALRRRRRSAAGQSRPCSTA
jgi:ABC-type proline/glycine betaine transport system permease subunit